MSGDLKILTPVQKSFFEENGYLHLPGFYRGAALDELRRQYHELVTRTEGRPANMSYSYMEAPEGYPPDEFNPKNVVGMMDQTLAGDFWFDQFTEPRVVAVLVDCLGPNLDFHNGKVRNKPPGFVAGQGWHQDWPYERHSEPGLAAAITYLDPTDASRPGPPRSSRAATAGPCRRRRGSRPWFRRTWTSPAGWSARSRPAMW